MVTGILRKMKTELANPVRYRLPVGEALLDMNERLGTRLELRYEGRIFCKRCGRETRKSFAQGFCFPCFRDAPENSECIIRPELCLAHEGEGRDPEWEREYHLRDHIVYLAVSSDLKVGVTRADEVHTRWVDQGASRAIRLAKTPNRYLAGRIEVAMKAFVSDRTQWQRMLKGIEPEDIDLVEKKRELSDKLEADLRVYLSDDDRVTSLVYPVETYPEKVKSLSFDKTREIAGQLTGIRGQYLYFDYERVLNIRKHAGYLVSVD